MRYLLGVKLNGIDLAGLDGKIYVEDIIEEPASALEASPMLGGGQFCHGITRDSMKITVKVMIKARRRDERADIIGKIFGWAAEGYLAVSYRPGKRIYARCTELPKTEAWDWTQRLEIVFTAFGMACWEDTEYASVTVTGSTQARTSFRPKGTLDCRLEAEVTNVSEENVTSLKLFCPQGYIELDGIEVAPGGKVTFGYDKYGILFIECDGESLLPFRTAESADELVLKRSENPNHIELCRCVTDQSCTTVFKARWLYR